MAATILSPSKDTFTPTPADYSETARYLGYQRAMPPDADIAILIQKACLEIFHAITPQATFQIFDLSFTQMSEQAKTATCLHDFPNPTDHKASLPSKPIISFSDVILPSIDLYHNLAECKKIALLAATIGPQIDALIRKQTMLNPAYAAVLQSAGATFIEKVVDYTNDQIKKAAASQGLQTKPRYSPGYGDVPLSTQKDFFRLLPCTRIGLTLMDTLIMAPEKSVTAFVGLF